MVSGERALQVVRGGEHLGGSLKMAADRKWPHEEVSAMKRAQSAWLEEALFKGQIVVGRDGRLRSVS